MVHEATRTPRERRHDDNERRILGAAMRMVEAGGVEALSINRLADEVDYTPGALYRYFSSKDALLARLVGQVLGEVAGYLSRGQELLAAGSGPLTRVVALVGSYRAFARREPQRFGLLAVSMADPRVLVSEASEAAPLAVAMMGSITRLAAALGAAATAGQIREGDAAERALCVFALVQGASQMDKQARRVPGVIDVERVVTRGLRALLLGFGADADTVDEAFERVSALGDLAERVGSKA